MTERALDDLLDLEKHKLSVVHKRKATSTERWMKYLGVPVGLAVFLALYYMPTPAGLTAGGQAVIASFSLALIWWVTEPFPTYVTSLVLMFLLLITRTSSPKAIMDVLGMEVIWLNLLAFILS